MATIRAGEVGHVAHHAENRDIHALEHAETTNCIAEGDVLGCCYDDGAIDDDLLIDCELDVASPWRKVQDEDIQWAPGY